jgi:hypothetical protein
MHEDLSLAKLKLLPCLLKVVTHNPFSVELKKSTLQIANERLDLTLQSLVEVALQ